MQLCEIIWWLLGSTPLHFLRLSMRLGQSRCYFLGCRWARVTVPRAQTRAKCNTVVETRRWSDADVGDAGPAPVGYQVMRRLRDTPTRVFDASGRGYCRCFYFASSESGMGRQCLAEIPETRVEGVDQLPCPPSYPMGLPPRWAVGSSMQGAGEAVMGRGMTVNVVVDTDVQTGIERRRYLAR